MSTTVATSRIYVASSWRNSIQPLVVTTLRIAGFDVYDFRNPAPGNNGFSWSTIDPYWRGWTDFDAMQWADTFVLLLPCGRSAHLEHAGELDDHLGPDDLLPTFERSHHLVGPRLTGSGR